MNRIKNKFDEAKELNLEAEKIFNDIEKERIEGEIKIKKILENASIEVKNIQKNMNNSLNETIKKKKIN